MSVVADITGWMDELGVPQPHILTAHTAIASVAIIVLFVLVVQLMCGRESRRDRNSVARPGFCECGNRIEPDNLLSGSECKDCLSWRV